MTSDVAPCSRDDGWGSASGSFRVFGIFVIESGSYLHAEMRTWPEYSGYLA
jgi:hypothetical protein